MKMCERAAKAGERKKEHRSLHKNVVALASNWDIRLRQFNWSFVCYLK